MKKPSPELAHRENRMNHSPLQAEVEEKVLLDSLKDRVQAWLKSTEGDLLGRVCSSDL